MDGRDGGSAGYGDVAGVQTHVHILVTNGELIPTLGKLLLFGLHPHFHADLIYSSRDSGKQASSPQTLREVPIKLRLEV
ncbi:hypothetical protein T484DRAFT_1790806 [Baffinella frigidus]|nr:hypothetical protein T484DRAFT_1790806 [Cryptophyta sp. CCMP2293]